MRTVSEHRARTTLHTGRPASCLRFKFIPAGDPLRGQRSISLPPQLVLSSRLLSIPPGASVKLVASRSDVQRVRSVLRAASD